LFGWGKIKKRKRKDLVTYPIEIVVEWRGFNLHFVNSRNLFKWGPARNKKLGGYIDHNWNDVYLLADIFKDKSIECDWNVFGHEMLHDVHKTDSKVKNPDTYKEDHNRFRGID